MCGIFAYLNYETPQNVQRILEILVDGLQRLEYRGYDSAGLCVDGWQDEEKKALIIKKKGRVAVLRDAVKTKLEESGLNNAPAVRSHLGIAHTRWATHGEPCDRNSHPHRSDEDCEFVIVHNGVVTNCGPLKELLQKEGMKFESDTDTEVIAKLTKYIWEKFFKGKEGTGKKPLFVELVMEVMARIDGAYGVVFKSKHFPDEVVCCKRGSPLIVGIKRGDVSGSQALKTMNLRKMAGPDSDPKEIFFSSDAAAVVEHTKAVIYMEDEDVCHVDNGEMSMYNRLAQADDASSFVQSMRTVHKMDMDIQNIMKGSYQHFMQKEIFEQPESCQSTMRGRVNFDTRQVTLGGFADNANALLRARRIAFIACGTSYYSASCARSLFEELTEVPITLDIASDFLDRQPPMFRDDVCCFVSQSGETADTLRALEYCKERGAYCVGFTNTVGSAIARATDCGAFINAGNEIGVASTKAYTSQCIAIVLLAVRLAQDSVSKQAKLHSIVDALKTLPTIITKTLELDADMKALAESLKASASILIMGRGYQGATCYEAALKIKELSYIHAEGILTGELKHGSLALIDEELPVIVIATKDIHYDKAKAGLQQVVARKGKAIVLLSEPDPEVEKLATKVVMVPSIGVDCLQGIVNIIPFQLLAYHLAVARGYDVDNPRNLAKSVTVE